MGLNELTNKPRSPVFQTENVNSGVDFLLQYLSKDNKVTESGIHEMFPNLNIRELLSIAIREGLIYKSTTVKGGYPSYKIEAQGEQVLRVGGFVVLVERRFKAADKAELRDNLEFQN